MRTRLIGTWHRIDHGLIDLMAAHGIRLLRIALAVTFIWFGALMHPDIAFQGGNPLLLTTTGEFVIKNLVLISAGIVIGSTVPQARA